MAAPQEVVAAYEGGDQAKQDLAESVIRQMYAPVIDVTGAPLEEGFRRRRGGPGHRAHAEDRVDPSLSWAPVAFAGALPIRFGQAPGITDR
ncbi:phosphogluconate dehydrogenase C-terminal domain-containing protein [Streptomyces fimicarius]|uniref:phosphogluconate dehydrogenase C-terminal domain-containing protein n=1 Tax=Streptomyces sp. JUS-F4 TaxID=2951988 RepID=UPI001E4A252C|nr:MULTISPECIES: phosphogluconate dehydrogenase C-terminal domain-containing protein [Streptomyces]MCX4713703.1 hypothetical protein [Streptomyces griseus]MDX2670658.1 phosphogluconate dehydrogenase C-terminal domain-containing protein [Streptomyces sp. NRRL_ISP-5395]MDX3507158.1 phosphogluconate dehydrogenase C-terminal domain-containing protein [Streptomyces sp. ATCC51928]MDX5524556.1 phosphogluconate dehydrogenase C-terminal domain-containing protein [Streptomyces sp. DE06-01C]WKN19328.1 hy